MTCDTMPMSTDEKEMVNWAIPARSATAAEWLDLKELLYLGYRWGSTSRNLEIYLDQPFLLFVGALLIPSCRYFMPFA